MVLSSRGILAIGLSLAGAAYLAAPSRGQQQQQADSAVRKAGTGNASASGPATPIPPVIGTIDLDVVFKNYEKVKASTKEFHSAMQLRRGELVKLENEARQEAEFMAKLTPGSEDFRKRENKITELKARLEAGREQAEREFSLKQAETMATLYKEVQAMAARVAVWRKMTYVVRVSNSPILGNDPNSVLAAINNTMVYADPRNDITNDVVRFLNQYYTATASPASTPKAAPRAPAAGGASGAGAAQPGEN